MREVVVRSRGVSPVVLDALAPVLRTHATLQHVLEWCRGHQPPRHLEDVVVQDTLTAWDHRPSAGALLAARLADGWKPRLGLARRGSRSRPRVMRDQARRLGRAGPIQLLLVGGRPTR
jgi:hypothetical protein